MAVDKPIEPASSDVDDLPRSGIADSIDSFGGRAPRERHLLLKLPLAVLAVAILIVIVAALGYAAHVAKRSRPIAPQASVFPHAGAHAATTPRDPRPPNSP